MIGVLVFEAEVREPYMGNAVPISVLIYQRKGDVAKVEVRNPEGMDIAAKFVSSTTMSERLFKLFHRETAG